MAKIKKTLDKTLKTENYTIKKCECYCHANYSTNIH